MQLWLHQETKKGEGMPHMVTVERKHYRACPIHLSCIVDEPGSQGGEIVKCAEGHMCPQWLIMDHSGQVVGKGSLNKPGVLLAGYLDRGVADPDDAVLDAPPQRVYHTIRRRKQWRKRRRT